MGTRTAERFHLYRVTLERPAIVVTTGTLAALNRWVAKRALTFRADSTLAGGYWNSATVSYVPYPVGLEFHL